MRCLNSGGPARLLAMAALAGAFAIPSSHAQPASRAGTYVPGPNGVWEHRRPAAVGMDSARVAAAIAFAVANESKAPRDLLLAGVVIEDDAVAVDQHDAIGQEIEGREVDRDRRAHPLPIL